MQNLTPKIKEYYMKDFNTNVLNCKNDFWDIDEGLRDILISINKNKNIQTLYSRRFNSLDEDNNISSFLWILLSPQANNDIVNNFIRECKAKKFEFGFIYVDKIVQNKDKNINLGCMTDSDYFKHGAILIDILSYNLEDHNSFWDSVKKYLPFV